MKIFRIDYQFIIISALVSLLATIAIIFAINVLHPGLISSAGGTSIFIYIGVFTANLIAEAGRKRLRK
ncbi:MAG TPA: hypothetical protein ENN05_08310 [Deltaproteobacteria bacterium]|nr:hypothetical protein [Deltaproteobacteria bacterium]